MGVGLEEVVGLTREEARARKRTLPMYPAHKPFHPSMIPSEREGVAETYESTACGGGIDQWATEEDPEEPDLEEPDLEEPDLEELTKPNGRGPSVGPLVCRHHARAFR